MSTINSTKFNESPALVKDNLTSEHHSVKDNFLFSNKNHKRKYVFQVYENYVEFTPPPIRFSQKNYTCSPRGTITTFTPRSRFRLFALLGKLKKIDNLNSIFVTLTYHYGYKGEEKKAQKDLHLFLARVRLFDPEIQYIWRIEFQKRGAPHFHFIILPGKNIKDLGHVKYSNHLNIVWHSIADPDSKAHAKYGFKVVAITDYLKACAYLSKYIAKLSDNFAGCLNSKHWGNSRDLPIFEYENITCIKERASVIIESIRKWLLRNGKQAYASPVFFNTDRPQGIFISKTEFETILLSVSGTMCDFNEGPDGFY